MASLPKRFFNSFFLTPTLLRGNENIIVIAFIVTLITFAIMSLSLIFNDTLLLTYRHSNNSDVLLRGIHVYGLFSGNRLIALRIDTEASLDVDVMMGLISYRSNGAAISYRVFLMRPIAVNVGETRIVYCYNCCNSLSSYKGYISVIKQNASIIVIDSSTGERTIRVTLSGLRNITINFGLCEDFIKFGFSQGAEGLALLSYAINNVVVLGESRGDVVTFYLIVPQRYGLVDISSSILKMEVTKNGKKYMINLICSGPERQYIQGFEWARISCQVSKEAT